MTKDFDPTSSTYRVWQVFFDLYEKGQWFRHCMFIEEGYKIPYKKYKNVHWQFSHEHIHRPL